MIGTFLSHSRKQFFRSSSFNRELATTIFLGLLGLMMLGYSLLLGFALDTLLTKALGLSDGLAFLNGVFVYYFVFEFIMRYFFQGVPVMNVQPYLHLPIAKSSIISYVLIRAGVNIFNLSTLLLFGPYTFMVVAPAYGSIEACLWLGALLLISFSLNYVNLLFKKKLDDSTWGLVAIIAVALVFAASDYFHLFKMSEITAPFFNLFVSTPFAIAIPLLWVALLVYISYRTLYQGLYPEDLAPAKQHVYQFNTELSFLNSLGLNDEWIKTEIKLIFRNKRTRQVLALGGFFLLYGLLFYTQERYLNDQRWFLLFVGLFMTGIFMLNYGQFLFSWQGSHFDFILTRPVSLRQYLASKYRLLSAVTIFCFFLTVPYAYFGWKILYIHFNITLFHLGVNAFIIMNFAMWDPKKIDLTKGSTFNYQGTGAAQWLMGLPILIIPYLIYLPFELNGYEMLGLTAIGIIGTLGILMNKPLLDFTARRLQLKKYSIATSFRKD